MLNKKLISIGGAGGVTLTALLLVFTVGITSEMSTETQELPTVMGGTFPPPYKLAGTDIGNEIPKLIKSETKELDGQSKDIVNPEYAKYQDVQVIDGYDEIHVYQDNKGDKDVILGKIPVSSELTNMAVLYSQNYIWITIEPHDEKVSMDVYRTAPLNRGYELVEINDSVKYAPLKGMTQIVYPDGEYGVIAPLDLWFVTENNSYTIRGHITEEQAVELANNIISIEG